MRTCTWHVRLWHYTVHVILGYCWLCQYVLVNIQESLMNFWKGENICFCVSSCSVSSPHKSKWKSIIFNWVECNKLLNSSCQIIVGTHKEKMKWIFRYTTCTIGTFKYIFRKQIVIQIELCLNLVWVICLLK